MHVYNTYRDNKISWTPIPVRKSIIIITYTDQITEYCVTSHIKHADAKPIIMEFQEKEYTSCCNQRVVITHPYTPYADSTSSGVNERHMIWAHPVQKPWLQTFYTDHMIVNYQSKIEQSEPLRLHLIATATTEDIAYAFMHIL